LRRLLKENPQAIPKDWGNNSRAGRNRIEEFQRTVSSAVLVTLQPDVNRLNILSGVNSTAISPTHLRPSRLKQMKDVYGQAGAALLRLPSALLASDTHPDDSGHGHSDDLARLPSAQRALYRARRAGAKWTAGAGQRERSWSGRETEEEKGDPWGNYKRQEAERQAGQQVKGFLVELVHRSMGSELSFMLVASLMRMMGLIKFLVVYTVWVLQ
jgi:hypothetical protein